jgi:hypothetical protein
MHRVLFLGLPLVLSLAACTYDNGDARRVLEEGSSSCPDGAEKILQSWIDVDAQIETQPGEGAGLFFEYAKGGHWTLRTTCDSVKTNAPCAWDVLVTPEDGRSISNVQPQGLEAPTDSVGPFLPDFPGTTHLVAETTNDIDGITFDTEPQTAISVDALLDGVCALPYFLWVDDGEARRGSTSNPLVLVPRPE